MEKFNSEITFMKKELAINSLRKLNSKYSKLVFYIK